MNRLRNMKGIARAGGVLLAIFGCTPPVCQDCENDNDDGKAMPTCGNGSCDPGESAGSCAADCTIVFCAEAGCYTCAFPYLDCQPPEDSCAVLGWYGDGVCDVCPSPDPDCEVAFDFCDDLGWYGDGYCDDCPEPDPDCSIPGDLCAEYGWYGDGECDDCPTPDPDCEPDVESGLHVFVNPGDPRLASFEVEDGTFTAVGTRDSQGAPAQLHSIEYVGHDESESAISYIYSESGPLKRIVVENGPVFEFEWQSPDAAVVTVVSADGSVQLNTYVEMNPAGEDAYRTRTRSNVASPTADRRGLPIELLVEENDAISLAAKDDSAVRLAAFEYGSSPLFVNVHECGEPAGSVMSVEVTILDKSAMVSIPMVVPAQATGTPGQYRVDVPTEPNPNVGETFEDACGKAAATLDVACTASGGLPEGAESMVCASIAAAIDAATIPSGEAIPIAAACEGAYRALQTYCETLGSGPAPGGPSAVDSFCEGGGQVIDQVLGPGELEVSARARLLTGTGSIGPMTVSGAGPFPELTINVDGDAAIGSLTTSPSDPGPSQGYVATAIVRCVPANTTVTISVSGTDGYSDSASSVVTGNSTLTISVPGGASSVSDTITVTILGGATRTVSLVF